MMAINSTQDLSSSVGRFYLPLNRTAEDDPVFSLPYIDEADGGKDVFCFSILSVFSFEHLYMSARICLQTSTVGRELVRKQSSVDQNHVPCSPYTVCLSSFFYLASPHEAN